ncbi:MAG: alpha amylase C-terminal domain-containing protein, partial [Bdellovibrio bacteriovorus]
RTLDWYVLDFPLHQGILELVRALNGLYREEPPLHAQDFDWQGFEWIDCHDAQNSVLIYQRRGREEGQHLVVALNFTPVPREGYRIGMPAPGAYQEVLSSDAQAYGGGGMGNGPGPLATEAVAWMNRPQSLVVTLPPLAGIVLKPVAPTAARPRGTAEWEAEIETGGSEPAPRAGETAPPTEQSA